MNVPAELADGTLTVYLPESLVVATRADFVDTVAAALREGVLRVRLDASTLATLDAAGIGALVRAGRMARGHTGEQPRLVHCPPDVIEALTETAVLPHLFHVGD
jgi:anti-anti-sigma regulatory factor